MAYQRILTIQDISCVAQASLTVALPILSAAGHETAILPTAVLSTHSVGFEGYTFRDLTEDIPAIGDHWHKEGITFDAFYTGYLGSGRQVDYIKDVVAKTSNEESAAHGIGSEDAIAKAPLLFVDPAMADHGILYPDFDDTFVDKMKELAFSADVLLPNITEAALLTGMEYKEDNDEVYIRELLINLAAAGKADTIVLTGVSFDEDTTGVMVYENGEFSYHSHEKVDRVCHGTGDVFASAFVGAYLNGKSADESAAIAADFVLAAILNTVDDEAHWYGVKFEIALPEYAAAARR